MNFNCTTEITVSNGLQSHSGTGQPSFDTLGQLTTVPPPILVPPVRLGKGNRALLPEETPSLEVLPGETPSWEILPGETPSWEVLPEETPSWGDSFLGSPSWGDSFLRNPSRAGELLPDKSFPGGAPSWPVLLRRGYRTTWVVTEMIGWTQPNKDTVKFCKLFRHRFRLLSVWTTFKSFPIEVIARRIGKKFLL